MIFFRLISASLLFDHSLAKNISILQRTDYLPKQSSPSCFIINSSIGTELIKTLRKKHTCDKTTTVTAYQHALRYDLVAWVGGGGFSWNNYEHSRSFSKGSWLLVSITVLQPTDHISTLGRLFRLYRQSKPLRQTLDDS